ncbi:hypothetical protein Snoj_44130 [Streptomyces nojiriensis]|uniref:Conjugal transfer protein n=1 Tax=Streptomyces nojiriensis TaxID=66374 RepID=A0ABQ3SQU8_9ACTN|nr:hypothetical protein [Streptomyces nojiriensis]QTI44026.1 hypothetical protein JYK04_01789 [Streptomyces nojiriensis]QTI44044.1 hypothetical protein JYK04_01807 [Streptomyces nojiriensis]GGR85713.1 hypothetical protein GCM10010205_12790 [Streptomyces nojiriensis]GHI70495.1 hypothetical protein Snoj_44130 [Streptomyces nojiriensis]
MTGHDAPASRRPLSRAQKVVLASAFVPMLATGVAGGAGTFSNISHAYGAGTALGAVAAGEGATAVLALVLLGLTMLGQSAPGVVRLGLWVLPAAAAVMAATAAPDPGRTVIYAVTPMGMCVSAEGMAFLARRIVVHTDGRDAEAEARAAAVVQQLAYHRAVAANHPDAKVQARSERTSWKLARKVGTGDLSLGSRLLDVQRERITDGADAALAGMFSLPVTPAVTPDATAIPIEGVEQVELERVTPGRDAEDTQVTGRVAELVPGSVTDESHPGVTPVTLDEVAAVAGVPVPHPTETLTDEQLLVVLRHLRYSTDPPMSYRQAATAFRDAGFVGGEKRVRTAWGALMSQEENAT